MSLFSGNTRDTSDSGWFYHYDEAGNVILITDKNGGLIKHFEQDAWGNDLNGTFATTQNIRQHQTGKYLDEATGLYFFGARWYDPNIGRFISVSPLSPLGEEEYVYCGDDPVNLVDPNGFEPITITALSSAVLTGAMGGAIGGGFLYLGKIVLTDETFSWSGLGYEVRSGAVWGSILGPIGRVAGPYLGKIPFIGKLFSGADDVEKVSCELNASRPIPVSLGAMSRAEHLAVKLGLNINSPTTRQLLNN